MSERLDLALVARGLVRSRSQAGDLVRRGHVLVNGRPAGKPAQLVSVTDVLEVEGGRAEPVSRAADKLAAALDHFALSPAGRIALDVGAATGGFTQVLIERGAVRVYAVDVGHGQLHPDLGGDPRVVSLEGLDARRLTTREVPEAPAALTVDVSFIPVGLVLPAMLALAAPGAWLVVLVKPQFELGPGAAGRSGVVRDLAAGEAAAGAVAAWLAGQPAWEVIGRLPSPLPGRDGNREHLIAARRAG